MALPGTGNLTKYTGIKFTQTDWDNNVDAIVSFFAGTYDSAFSKLGVGTTTLTYQANMASSTLARTLNLTNTYATGTTYGAYIENTGASTTNIGLTVAASGATLNYGIVAQVTGATANDRAITATLTGTGNLAATIEGINAGTATNNIGGQFTCNGAGTNSFGINCTVTNATGEIRGASLVVSGSATSTFGAKVGNTATGTSAYGYDATVSGAATTNYGVNLNVTGATTNYGLYTNDAAFNKIGYNATTAPTASVANGSMFIAQVSGTDYIYVRSGGAWVRVALS